MLPEYRFSRRSVAPRHGSLSGRIPTDYWAFDGRHLARHLQSGPEGLPRVEAERRLVEFGSNELRTGRRLSRLNVLGRQLRSPLLLLLVFAAGASLLTGEWLDAATPPIDA